MREKVDTGIYVVLAFLGVFYTHALDYGIKWQLFFPIVLIYYLISNKLKFKIELKDSLLIFVCLASLLCYFFTLNRYYFNMFAGVGLSIVISRMRINFRVGFLFATIFVVLNLLESIHKSFEGVDQRLSSSDSWIIYTLFFDTLNNIYQVNDSALFLFFSYIYFSLNDSRIAYVNAFLMFLHTSRLTIVAFVVNQMRNKRGATTAAVYVLIILLIIYLFFGEDFINYYYFNIDESVLDRSDRFYHYALKAFDGFLILPRPEDEFALHNWGVEVFYYSGLVGLIYILTVICSASNIVTALACFIAFSAAKTVHDLLYYHMFIGFLVSSTAIEIGTRKRNWLECPRSEI